MKFEQIDNWTKNNNSKQYVLECYFFWLVCFIYVTLNMFLNVIEWSKFIPGMHWRWNVSEDLLMTVQFSGGSGATEKNYNR